MAYGKLKAEVMVVIGKAFKHAHYRMFRRMINKRIVPFIPSKQNWHNPKNQAGFVVEFMEEWDVWEKNIKKYLEKELKKKGRQSEMDKIYSQMRERAKRFITAAIKEDDAHKIPGRIHQFKVRFTKEIVQF